MINTVQVCLLKYIRYTVNFELPCQKGVGRYISSLFLQKMNNSASVTLVYMVGPFCVAFFFKCNLQCTKKSRLFTKYLKR